MRVWLGLLSVVVGACQYARPNDVMPIDAAPGACTAPGPNALECPPATPVCGPDSRCTTCVGDPDCADRPATQVCLGAPVGQCVTCSEQDHQAATPGSAADHCQGLGNQVCDGSTHTCRACQQHAECNSDVCSDGDCVDSSDVVYIAPDGTATSGCTRAAPCGTLALGLSEVSGTRRFILAAPGVYLDAGATIIDRTVTIFADGALFERNGAGHILEVRGPGAMVTLDGATVHNAGGAGLPDGIRCAGGATLVLREVELDSNRGRGLDSAECDVRIDRSLISNNLKAGLRVERGRIVMTNSIVIGNGAMTEVVGGLEVAPDLAGSRIEFSTFRKNLASVGRPGALACSGAGVAARNNIIFGSVNTDVEAFGVACTHSFSIIGPANTPAGTEVRSATLAEVAFVEPNGSFASAVHLLPTSIARGLADPASDAVVDFDGDRRPNPAGSRADVGADEVP